MCTAERNASRKAGDTSTDGGAGTRVNGGAVAHDGVAGTRMNGGVVTHDGGASTNEDVDVLDSEDLPDSDNALADFISLVAYSNLRIPSTRFCSTTLNLKPYGITV